jgi:hypothetical protein
MLRFATVGIAVAALSLAASPSLSRDQQSHMDMSGMDTPARNAASLPHEAGQGAFAAISEIVSLLEADPTTDWSKVDIDALRQHLVDMNNVIIQATVVTTPVTGGARFDISSDSGAVRQSIQHMVAAHTTMADGQDGLHVVSAPNPSGASMTVTGSGDESEAKIRGLGFFGLMTSGVHHQLHHLMIAKGQMHH